MDNRFALKILSETQTEFGYVIRKEIWPSASFEVECPPDADPEIQELADTLEGKHPPTEMTTCYTNAGDWIGDLKTAELLCKEKGILPEHQKPRPTGLLRPCNIGFCPSEQKWYGWSHRAINGFGIGSHVKPGDLAYRPKTESDFRQKYLQFFGIDKYHIDPKVRDSVDSDGKRGALITATRTQDVPNEKLRGTEYSCFWPYENEKFGKGEWVAETLEDARQMACDFADGVS